MWLPTSMPVLQLVAQSSEFLLGCHCASSETEPSCPSSGECVLGMNPVPDCNVFQCMWAGNSSGHFSIHPLHILMIDMINLCASAEASWPGLAWLFAPSSKCGLNWYQYKQTELMMFAL